MDNMNKHNEAENNDASWGARINTSEESTIANDCPSWATPAQQQRWAGLGLVLWNHRAHQIVRLAPVNTLYLLDQLRTQDAWQQQGLTVNEVLSRERSTYLNARRYLKNP